MKKTAKIYLFVKILQNGIPIAETKKPLGKAKNLKISTSSNSELSLPLYPLIEDIELIKIHKKSITLSLTDPWSGFITTKGNVVELDPHDREEKVFTLFLDDYASIQLNDLHVLIKVNSDEKTKSLSLDSKYAPRFLSLLIKDKYERVSFLASILIASFLIGSVTIGLNSRNSERPRVFEELADSYTLPFIDADNLVTSPEALQENLDRYNYIPSIVDFYRNFMNIYLGYSFEPNRYVLPSIIQRYKKVYINYQSDLNSKLDKHETRLIHISENKPVLSIPAVYGESFQQKIIRTINKINFFHESLKSNLNDRFFASESFRKDPDYDWTNYTNIKDKMLTEDLAKIKVFKQNNNEASMYRDAEKLGYIASHIRNSHNKHKDFKIPLSETSVVPLTVSHDIDFASLKNNINQIFHDQYFTSLVASTLGKEENKIIKEPLIGQIDLNKLKSAIKNNKYKLNLCYEKVLRRDHTLAGKMNWSWRIDSSGMVSEINLLKTTLSDNSLIECIKESLSTWQFPRPAKGSIKVSHSFVFEPQSG